MSRIYPLLLGMFYLREVVNGEEAFVVSNGLLHCGVGGDASSGHPKCFQRKLDDRFLDWPNAGYLLPGFCSGLCSRDWNWADQTNISHNRH